MIDLEEEIRKDIEEKMSKDIQEEIDFSIVADILKESGWTEVIIEPLTSKKQVVDLMEFVDKEFPGRYYGRGTRWLFKEPKDATMFILKQ